MKKFIVLLALWFSLPAFGAQWILVVLSSENKITLKDGITHPTGYFLSELAVPLQAMMDAGYEPFFATPKGNAPTMDKISDSEMWFGGDIVKYKKAQALLNSLSGLKSPLALKDIVGHENLFAGVFVPGGHAPMEDLYKDVNLGNILKNFHAAGKVTGLICHGPIALLSAGRGDQDWIYKGYKMTSFSTAEEMQEEPGQDNVLGGYVKFYPDQALRAAGADVSVADKWQSHVVKDRELITGQNPFSDHEFADAMVKALNQQQGR
jgi:putative intracellular protease/amidase